MNKECFFTISYGFLMVLAGMCFDAKLKNVLFSVPLFVVFGCLINMEGLECVMFLGAKKKYCAKMEILN